MTHEICPICKYQKINDRYHTNCRMGKKLIHLYVKTMAGDIIHIKVDPSDGGLAIRQKIYEKRPDFPVIRQSLFVKAEEMPDIYSLRLQGVKNGDEILLFLQDEIEETCEPDSRVSNYENKPITYNMTYRSNDMWADGIGKIQIYSKTVDSNPLWSVTMHQWFTSLEEMFDEYRKYITITDKQIANLIHLWWVYN